MSSSAAKKKPQAIPDFGRLLFVDPDELFLRRIQNDKKAGATAPICARLGSEAISALTDFNVEIAAIYVSLKTVSPDAASVIRACHQHRRGAPIFILSDTENCGLTPEQLEQMGVQKVQVKEFDYTEIAKQFLPPASLLDLNETLGKGTRESSGTVVENKDDGFFPIRASTFFSGSKSFFDLYVRLDSGKYLKILKSGEAFGTDRLESYTKKGVVFFYSKASVETDYIAFCDKILGAVINSKDLKPIVKIEQSFQQGERTLDFLSRRLALNGESSQFAMAYVDKLMALVKSLNLEKQSRLIKEMLKTSSHFDHQLGTVVIASLIARRHNFESDKSLRVVGLSALLHDIGLLSLPPELLHEDEARMTPEQISLFHEHPQRGSKILQELRGMDQIVPQTVALHHRRRDGSGFPNKSGLGLSQISITVEVVGIADELIRFLSNTPPTDPHYKEKMNIHVFNHFSLEVRESLLAIIEKGF